MIKFIRNIQINILHAAFHRNLKRAETARKQQNIKKFKQYVYAAEDAWRKLVIIKEKNKL